MLFRSRPVFRPVFRNRQAMGWIAGYTVHTWELAARRGATMGLHSMCGYAGGFIGPLGVGLALDHAGWGLGFAHLAAVTAIGFVALRRLSGAGR